MTPFVEDISRLAVVVFYTAALIMSASAAVHTRLWARRVSAIAFIITTVYWLWFYLAVANVDLTTARPIVLDSRIGHYVTATALFIAALLIRRADKYGIALALSRENNRTPDEQ